MVTLQILVLSFQVRILVAQQRDLPKERSFFYLYIAQQQEACRDSTKEKSPARAFIILYMPYHSAGIAYGYSVGRNIVCNHRACTNHSTVTNSHTRQNGHISTQPYILADSDRTVVKASFKAFYGINSVVRAYQATPRANERTMANSNDITVKKCAVKINKSHPLKVDILAHNALKARLYEYILVISRHKLLENLPSARR